MVEQSTSKPLVKGSNRDTGSGRETMGDILVKILIVFVFVNLQKRVFPKTNLFPGNKVASNY